MNSEFWRKTADSLKKDVNRAKNAISEKIKNIKDRNSSSRNDSLEDFPVHIDIDTISSISDDEGEEFDIVPIPGIETLSESSDPNDEEEIANEILSENSSQNSEEENLTETLYEENTNEILSKNLSSNSEEENISEIQNEESEQSNETENQAAEPVDPAAANNQLTALETQLQQLNQSLKDLRNRELIEIDTFNTIKDQKTNDSKALDALLQSNQYKGASYEQLQKIESDFKDRWLHRDEQQRVRADDIQRLRKQQSETLNRIAEIRAQIGSLQNQ